MAKVLIADDSIFMRQTIRLILEESGLEIAGEAENGLIAVGMYRECNPDVVTMDITMPEMDGLEALKAIRQMDPNAKVIIISAMGQECHVLEAIKKGAKSFIVKPFKKEQILEVIHKAINA